MSDKVNSPVKKEYFNILIFGFAALILSMYGPRLAPFLGVKAQNFIADNYVFRFFVILLIVYLTSKNIYLAFVIAVAFCLVISFSTMYKFREKFILENMNNYSDFDTIRNLKEDFIGDKNNNRIKQFCSKGVNMKNTLLEKFNNHNLKSNEDLPPQTIMSNCNVQSNCDSNIESFQNSNLEDLPTQVLLSNCEVTPKCSNNYIEKFTSSMEYNLPTQILADNCIGKSKCNYSSKYIEETRDSIVESFTSKNNENNESDDESDSDESIDEDNMIEDEEGEEESEEDNLGDSEYEKKCSNINSEQCIKYCYSKTGLNDKSCSKNFPNINQTCLDDPLKCRLNMCALTNNNYKGCKGIPNMESPDNMNNIINKLTNIDEQILKLVKPKKNKST